MAKALDHVLLSSHHMLDVMAGTGTPLRLRSGDPVVPAIHVLFVLAIP
jgi:hypothetical protein